MRNHTNVGYLRNKCEVSVGFAGGKPSPQSRDLFFSVASGRLLPVLKTNHRPFQRRLEAVSRW